MLKKREASKSSYVVEVEDVDVVKWNRNFIKTCTKELRSEVMPTFGSYLKYIERVDIDSVDDKELTVLFDKYFLYCCFYNKRFKFYFNGNYIDAVGYCNKEFKRYTESQTCEGFLGKLYNESSLMTMFSYSVNNDADNDDVPDYIKDAWSFVNNN